MLSNHVHSSNDIHITKTIRAKWLLIGSNPYKVDNLPSNHVHSSNESTTNSGVEWEEGISEKKMKDKMWVMKEYDRKNK